MANSFLRIMLAMYLAIWSPALCRCGIKEALGRFTGVAVDRCGGSSDAVIVPEPAEQASERGCCAQKRASLDATLVQVDAQCGNDQPSDQPRPCRCHQSLASKVRLDTGAKVVLPAIVKADFAVAMLPALAALASPTLTWRILRTDPHPGRPPPPGTLLAQHCLLLI